MEKIKNFFTNYKSDILNVLGVVALIAVVVVGAVLFFGKKDVQPNVVEDTSVVTTTEATTEAETTTTEPETATEAAVTTTKAPVTTTKAAPKPTEAPTKAPSNNTPNNTPVNTEEGTLPAGLAQNCEPGDGLYEMNLATYNQDAKVMEAYEKIKRENIPPSIGKKGGLYWQIDGVLVTLCERCGKPQGGGTHGTCGSSFNGCNCELCGEWIPAGGCHSCKY